MEKTEIRYDRKKLLFVMLFCFFWVIVTTLIIFSTKPYSTYTIVKAITVLVNLFVLYIGCVQIKLFIENAPVLTLSETGMVFNNNGKVSNFEWQNIINLEVVQVRAGNRGKTDVLMITLHDGTKKIPLAPLEKSVDEIKGLLGKYRNKPL